MAKATTEQRTAPPGDILRQAKIAYNTYENERRELSRQAAEAVVASGGVAEMDVFMFAMHGVVSDWPTMPKDRETEGYYSGLKNKFERGPIARRTTSYGSLPMVDVIARPKWGKWAENESTESSVHFTIRKEFPGYVGNVSVELTDMHVWNSLDGTKPSEVKGAKVVDLARIGVSDLRHQAWEIENYTGRYAVGLEEIYGLRELGAHGDEVGDLAFLGRIATFVGNTSLT